MDEFYGGGQTGQFHTEQQITPEQAAYHPTSVQQQIMLSSNGYSKADADRRTLGGADNMLPTTNGQSESTYQQRMPLASPYRTFG
jgi:hypothetical protein